MNYQTFKNQKTGLLLLIAAIAAACSPQINSNFKTFSRSIASTPVLIWDGATSLTIGTCSAYTLTNEVASVATPMTADTTVTLTNTGAGVFYSNSSCTLAVTSAVIHAGSSSVTLYFSDATAQNLLLNATSSPSSSIAFAVTILDAATKLAFSSEPASTEASGVALTTQPVVQIQDSLGNLVTSVNGAITLAAFTNSSCTIAASGALTASANPLTSTLGSASFIGLTYTGSGTIYLKASSSGLTSACSTAIVVSAASASKLAFTTEPSSTESSGVALSTQPVVQVQDAYGNLFSSATNSITLAAYTDSACTTLASGTLTATTNPLAASAGSASFSAVTYSGTPTSLYLKASSSGLTSACSSIITVSAGAASKLMFSTQPSSSANSGTALSTQPVLHVDDASGNLVSSATNSITLAAFTDSACTTSASGTLSVTTNPLAATSGSASFAGVTYSGTAGTVYIKASTTGLTAACSTAIVVSAGTATTLVYSTEPSSSGNSGTALSTQPVLHVDDAAGNLVSSATNSITLSAFTDSACTTAASGTLSATTNPLAATSGSASFSGLTYTGAASSIYIKAAASGLTSACSTVIAFSAAVATKLVFSTEPSSTETSGAALATQPVVQVEDASSNLVSSATNSITLAAYTDSACTTAASGTFSATTNPLAASSGSASFAAVTYTGATGTIYIKASASGLTSACSSAIVLSSGSSSKLAFTTEPSGTENSGAAMGTQPVVKVEDASGNVNSSATNSITLAAFTDSGCTTAASGTLGATTNPLSASSGVASFAATTYTGAAGTIYVKASASGLTSACSTAIVIAAGTATQLVFSTEPSATENSGSALSTQPVIQIQDASSNLVSTATNSITLSAFTDSGCTTSAAGTLSATTNPLAASSGASSFAAVTYTGSPTTIYLKASASGLTATCSIAIVVSVGNASKLAFSTEPSSSVNSGTAFSTQPVVQVEDASNTLVSGATNSITLTAYTDAECTTAASGTFSATTNPLSASSGAATFTGITYTGTTGTIYLKASASGLTGACSSAIVVGAGSPSKLIFSTEPSSTEPAGAALVTQPVIQIQDAFNNLATSATNGVTLAAFTDSGCTTAAPGTFSATTNPLGATSGVATFSGVTYAGLAGNSVYIKASASGLTSACSTAIAISIGAASKLVFTTQPSRAAPGASIGSPAVTVEDAGGNPITSSTASITVAIGNNAGPSGNLSGTKTVSAVSGVATFPGLSMDTGGVGYTLTASASSLTTGTSAGFVVTLTYHDQFNYTPNAPGASVENGSTKDASGNIYTVGSTTDGTGATRWIVKKYNGISWSVLDNYQYVNGLSSAAFAAAFDPLSGNIYVVGTGSAGGNSLWIVRQYSGGVWSTIDTYQYSGGDPSQPASVAVDSSGAVYVAGNCDDGNYAAHWIVRKYSSGSWSTIDDYLYSGGNEASASGIALDSSNNVYVVGYAMDSSYIPHWITRVEQSGSWTTIDDYLGTNPFIGYAYGVTIDSSGDVFVCGMATSTSGGYSSQVREYTGGTWTTIDDFSYNGGVFGYGLAVTIDSTGKVYVAGKSYDSSFIQHWVVRQYSGGAWNTSDEYDLPSGVSSAANALVGDASGNVYASGEASDVSTHWLTRKFNGTSWSTVDTYQLLSVDTANESVGTSSTGNVFASSTVYDANGLARMTTREFTNGNWATVDDYSHPGSLTTMAHGGIAADLAGNVFVLGSTTESGSSPGHWIVRELSGGSWSTSDDYVYPNGALYASANGIAADSAGNIFTMGCAYDQNYSEHWVVREFNGSTWSTVDDYVYPNGYSSSATAIGTDVNGNVYVGGTVEDDSFQTHALIREESGGIWTTIDDYVAYQSPSAIGVDSSNNIYVAGVDYTNTNYWYVREISGGSASQTDSFSYASGYISTPESLTIDGSGNVYVGGYGIDSSQIDHAVIRKYSAGSWSTVLDYQFVSGYGAMVFSVSYSSPSQEVIWAGYGTDSSGNKYGITQALP